MYINNSNITLPDDNDTIVWKYLDLSKDNSVCKNSKDIFFGMFSLIFCMLCLAHFRLSRSDKFEDQYEGTFSEPTFEHFVILILNFSRF